MYRNKDLPKYTGDIQVIGAGYGRTGTLSLKKALEILYNAPCYHMTEVNNVNEWNDILQYNKHVSYHKILKGYACTQDYPACLKYLDLLNEFPHAKVILTIRKPNEWYNSLKQTISRMDPMLGNQGIGLKILSYIPPLLQFMKLNTLCLYVHTFNRNKLTSDVAIQSFQRHINDVKSNVPPDKLLIYDVKEGWEPLCKFLDKDIPNIPFPNINDSKSLSRLINLLNYFGIGLMVVLISVIIGLISYIV